MDKLSLFTTDELFAELSIRYDAILFCSIKHKSEDDTERVQIHSGEPLTLIGMADMAMVTLRHELRDEYAEEEELDEDTFEV